VKAVRDFGKVKAGDIGGFVQSEVNLSHSGECWVFGDARISGNAKVFGDARIFGNAEVFGNDIVMRPPLLFTGLPGHNITVTDNHINIGCEQHTPKYWLENYREIGEKHNYSKENIKVYRDFIKLICRNKRKNRIWELGTRVRPPILPD